MLIYLVIEQLPYESSTILGIYDKEEQARSSLKEEQLTSSFVKWDEITVDCWEIGGTCLWSEGWNSQGEWCRFGVLFCWANGRHTLEAVPTTFPGTYSLETFDSCACKTLVTFKKDLENGELCYRERLAAVR